MACRHRYTIADIGMFGYVSMASQGGYEMEDFRRSVHGLRE